MKKYLKISFGVLIILIGPIAGVAVVRIREWNEGNWLFVFLLGCAIFGVVYVLIVDRLLIRRVVRNYEPTEERPRLREFQQLRADDRSWFGLISSALFFLFLSLAGLFGVLSGGLTVEAGIFVVFILSFFGAQDVFQIVLKRQGNISPDRG